MLQRGECMEKAEAAGRDYDEAMRHFEEELMLHINERLYQKKVITFDMYMKAKDLILKS